MNYQSTPTDDIYEQELIMHRKLRALNKIFIDAHCAMQATLRELNDKQRKQKLREHHNVR